MSERMLMYLLAGVLVAGLHRLHLGWYRRHVQALPPDSWWIWMGRMVLWPLVAAFLAATFMRGLARGILKENGTQ